MIALVAAGVFDPQPLGVQQWSAEPGLLVVSEPHIDWQTAVAGAFSAEMGASYNSGATDSGYGLVVGDAQAHLGVAVSPLGYLTVWETLGTTTVDHLPWQTWPHVRTGQAANDLRLDWDGETVTLWVNRERLWDSAETSALTRCTDCQLGIWGQSFAGETTVNVTALRLFYD
jgi:hypothetical protein